MEALRGEGIKQTKQEINRRRMIRVGFGRKIWEFTVPIIDIEYPPASVYGSGTDRLFHPIHVRIRWSRPS